MVPASPARVRPGIDVLLANSAHLLRDRRVGLVTNNAGVDAAGISNVTRLREAGVRLVALFSPEHGFRGAADPGAAVASTTDSATGLPIYSLYGRTSAPTAEMLRGIDVMLVDLQDVGARYYTYLATAIDVMRGVAGRDITVLVLDRPNPIGGAVQGTVLDPAFASTVGRLAVPMRHGMTLGELVRLAKADLALTAPLTVIPAAGWRRNVAFDETGLPFIPPSPNLRTVESLFHYPGTCLFEGTNLSVGRGSDAPFQQIGAPWLDTTAVLAAMRRLRLPGVEFRGATFTPRRPGDAKYADTAVAGIRLTMTDRHTYDPVATAIHLLAVIRARHRDQFAWIPPHFDRLAGNRSLRAAIDADSSAMEIVAAWEPALRRFEERRKPYLLYPAR
jgi:uncharacterized protein YbbC (DUF1343 family)